MPDQPNPIDAIFGDNDYITLDREQYLDFAKTINEASALAYMMGVGRHVKGQAPEIIEATLKDVSDEELRSAVMYVASSLLQERYVTAMTKQLTADIDAHLHDLDDLEAAAAAGDLD